VPGLAAAPHNDRGAGDGGHNAAYVVLVVLLVLLVATAVIAVTTLTGSETASGTPATEKTRKLPVYWKVHTGDSYQSIARKTGLTVQQLEAFNPYVNPDTIQPGQRLQLRARVPRGKAPAPGPRFYTVRSGDTFASIAQKTHHSMLHLIDINPKVKPETLRPGQRVRLRR
jgi:LysM repeat protein